MAKQQVRAYNRAVWRAVQTDDEKALVSAVKNPRGSGDTYTDPVERRVMAQAVWNVAHDQDRPGMTASAASNAFQPEILAQPHKPQRRLVSEIAILGTQHESNLGKRVSEKDRPRTLRLQVLLEDHVDVHGRRERQLAAFELDDGDGPAQSIGYLPKDAHHQVAVYLASWHRSATRGGLKARSVY